MTAKEPMLTSGIDLLVTCPSLEAIVAALETALGLTRDDIVGPDDDMMHLLEVLKQPMRSTIMQLDGGDFPFKVDLDGGLEKRDYEALARRFAAALSHDVVMPDERAPDPISSIRIRHDMTDALGWIEDAEPDGYWFRMPSPRL
jgi:hypothetical protein